MGYMRYTSLIGLVAMSVASAAQAQTATGATATPVSRPFVPGERLSYDVYFGAIKVGTGSMEVRGIDTVRGRPAYHTAFSLNGGIPFYKVDDVFESWFATDDLASLRFNQDQNEGTKERQHRYEIYPERRTYEFQRYFKPDRNPVTIRVERRERVKVPAGTFDAIVIQPVIKTKGVFSESGHAELWISDDDRRVILQMKSQLSFGSLDLYLTTIQRP